MRAVGVVVPYTYVRWRVCAALWEEGLSEKTATQKITAKTAAITKGLKFRLVVLLYVLRVTELKKISELWMCHIQKLTLRTSPKENITNRMENELFSSLFISERIRANDLSNDYQNSIESTVGYLSRLMIFQKICYIYFSWHVLSFLLSIHIYKFAN